LGLRSALAEACISPLSQLLANEGFFKENGRFVKKTAKGNFWVDFLTERPSPTSNTKATVDDMFGVCAFFGVDRALKICRQVEIEGTDLDGAHVKERVRVCEVGPFLCLKLQAYQGRAEKKDLFDVI
jgi:hypothetical protein